MDFSSEANLLKNNLKNINEISFDELALQIFKFQYQFNPIYQEFVHLINVQIQEVNDIKKIPFLPIELFKLKNIKSYNTDEYDVLFYSSGTGGNRSIHIVKESEVYHQAILNSFEFSYGSIEKYIFYCLTPSIETNPNSSLGYMCQYLCGASKSKRSKIYPNEEHYLNLVEDIKNHPLDKIPFVIGVSFALLDFLEKFAPELPKQTIIIETGGMKGRKEELIKEEFHNMLRVGFGTAHIHSEYGMAELLSQSYAKDGINFDESPYHKVLIRDLTDPFSYLENDQQGGINIIDLSNLFSCSFIQTKDIGIQNQYSFRILGRIDHSEQRGCSLLYI